MSCFFKL